MDRYKRMKSSHAGSMDRFHNQFLAGAALSGDQHVGVGRSDCLNGFVHSSHRPTLANNISRSGGLSDRFAQAHILLLGAAMRERLLHQMRNLVRVERLTDVVVSAIL